MSRNGRVVVALSGGVDSAVAAGLLREQGYDCVGVFMRVGVEGGAARSRPRSTPGQPGPAAPAARRLRHGCCSVGDAQDARTAAARLGIPFYALNFRDDFERIVDYFVDEYSRARTPNPCAVCNIDLKFGKLLRYADLVDAEHVATGHYARILDDAGAPRLARAACAEKDQTYVLFGVRRDALARCLFPIGHVAHKAEVRRLAADLGLSLHDKPESQEICFVPEGDYRALLEARRPELLRPGEIRDESGRVLGRHEGVAAYTIGQRRGLGALGRPVYVTRLDVLANVVTVGDREALLSSGLVAERFNWLVDPPAVGAWGRAEVKIRRMHTAAGGRFRVHPDGAIEVAFDSPQPAVTPGQAAVLYDGDVVLGGGWIR